jgi:aspartate carbamoyltransferase catalytic subunit
MPSSKSSLIKLDRLSAPQIDKLFSDSLSLKQNFNKHQLSSGVYHSGYKGTAALLFFEPSTRTRFSFEAACSRAGYHPLILDGGVGTSIEKGETIEDTVYNIRAMRPLFFIIRCNDQVNLSDIDKSLPEPVLNAGWGRQGHPTQALLDALTMFEKWNSISGKNVLFVGDIKHSRVVSSHLELAKILSYNVGYSAPAELLPKELAGAELFSKVEEGLEWADAVIALRVQKERHDSENIFLLDDYRDQFGLNNKRVKILKTDGLIMHPGPINYGVELETEILSDPRSCILKQVENGVFLREALIRGLFN